MLEALKEEDLPQLLSQYGYTQVTRLDKGNPYNYIVRAINKNQESIVLKISKHNQAFDHELPKHSRTQSKHILTLHQFNIITFKGQRFDCFEFEEAEDTLYTDLRFNWTNKTKIRILNSILLGIIDISRQVGKHQDIHPDNIFLFNLNSPEENIEVRIGDIDQSPEVKFYNKPDSDLREFLSLVAWLFATNRQSIYSKNLISEDLVEMGCSLPNNIQNLILVILLKPEVTIQDVTNIALEISKLD